METSENMKCLLKTCSPDLVWPEILNFLKEELLVVKFRFLSMLPLYSSTLTKVILNSPLCFFSPQLYLNVGAPVAQPATSFQEDAAADDDLYS